MNYEDRERKYKAILEEYGFKLFEISAKSSHPFTARALITFVTKLEAIKASLFDCIESENPYSFRILFRCLCEHYLKFIYIYLKHSETRSDTIGEEFYKYCGMEEMRGYANAIGFLSKLNGKGKSPDIVNFLKEYYPDEENLSKAMIQKKSGQFSYRSILEYLSKRHPDSFSGNISFLEHIIPVYAELSGFVHGGPSADQAMLKFASEKSIADMESKGSIVSTIASSTFMHTAQMLSRESEEANDIYVAVRKGLE